MFAAAARVLSVLMMTNPGDTMDEDAPVHSDDAMMAGDTAEGAGETAAPRALPRRRCRAQSRGGYPRLLSRGASAEKGQRWQRW